MESNNKNIGNFNVNYAYDQLVAIVNRPYSNPSEAIQIANETMDLLKAINQSGYETGFTDAMKFQEDDKYLLGLPQVDNNENYQGSEFLKSKPGIYRIIWNDDTVSTCIVSKLNSREKWIAATTWNKGFVVDKELSERVKIATLITE